MSRSATRSITLQNSCPKRIGDFAMHIPFLESWEFHCSGGTSCKACKNYYRYHLSTWAVLDLEGTKPNWPKHWYWTRKKKEIYMACRVRIVKKMLNRLCNRQCDVYFSNVPFLCWPGAFMQFYGFMICILPTVPIGLQSFQLMSEAVY